MPEKYRSGGHWEQTEWCSLWKQPAREPTIVVRLDCRCLRRYPEPAPVVGAQVVCGSHLNPARVIAHEKA